MYPKTFKGDFKTMLIYQNDEKSLLQIKEKRFIDLNQH